MKLINDADLLLDVIAINSELQEVHPFLGLRGRMKDKFSVNLTSSNRGNFLPYSEEQLRKLIVSGGFSEMGRIRMVTRHASSRSSAKAYAPIIYLGKSIKRGM